MEDQFKNQIKDAIDEKIKDIDARVDVLKEKQEEAEKIVSMLTQIAATENKKSQSRKSEKSDDNTEINILWIGDNKNNAFRYSKLLESLKYNVKYIDNYSKAPEELESKTYVCIIGDTTEMEWSDDFIQGMVRMRNKYHEYPLFLLTPLDANADKLLRFKNSMNVTYLTQSPQKLITEVNDYIKKRYLRRSNR